MVLKNYKKLDENLRIIVKSSVIVFFGLIISKVLSYAYRIIIARSFGPEEYGLFSLSLAIVGFFIAVFGFGLNEGLLRFISLFRGKKETQKMRYLFRFSLLISLISGVVAAIILFSFSNVISINIFHNPGLEVYLKIFSLLIPISLVWGIYIAVIRAFELITMYSFINNILQNVLKIITFLIFIFFGFSTYKVISFSYILAFAFILIISYYVCKYKIGEIFGKYFINKKNRDDLKRKFLTYSLPLSFAGFVSIILYWTDSLFLGYFKSAFEIGLYNAVIPIAMLLAIAPELFIQLFLPLITRYYSQKKNKLIKEISKQVGKWIFIINLAVFGLGFIFPGAFINILFGKEYLVAENALRILLVGSFMSSISYVSSNLIRTIGKSNLILADITIASILNAILNYILIPMKKIGFIENSLGLNGAALATAISAIVLSILFIFQTKYYLKFFPFRRKMIGILFIFIIPAAVMLYIRTFINVSGILKATILSLIFIILYLILIFITKSLDKNDLLILKAMKDKVLGKLIVRSNVNYNK